MCEWRGVENAEQFVDVDFLDRQAAAYDVVTRSHQLDARAAEVGVQVAGGEVDRLARLQGHPIEQQGDDCARVARVSIGQGRHELRLDAVAAFARHDRGSWIELPAVDRLDRGGHPVGTEHVRQFVGPDGVEQRERRLDRPDAAQCVESGERTEQFRFGAIVGVDAACEPVDGL